jgi:hypothetical protein
MICTKDRPTALRNALDALSVMARPDSLELRIVITDNSADGQRDAIQTIATAAGVAIEYAHEPIRGYASVRNAALLVALSGPADLMIFIDDDMLPRPDMLQQYCAVFSESGADVVAGLSHQGAAGFREGQRLKKSTTQNVAFGRRLVAPAPDGLGLRFDTRLDRLGGEDFDFFTRATMAGAVAIASRRPMAVEQPLEALPEDQRPAPGEDVRARLVRARMDGRNDIVSARLRGGLKAGLLQLGRRYPVMAQRVLGEFVKGHAVGLISREQRAAHSAKAAALASQVIGAIQGLAMDGLDRPEAKRGRLVPAGVFPPKAIPAPVPKASTDQMPLPVQSSSVAPTV